MSRMNAAHSWKRIFVVCLLLAFESTLSLRAQAPRDDDDTYLEQIIIFGRHGVRSNAVPASTIAVFASRPYPEFDVPPRFLTPHGAQAEVLSGAYYREYLLAERLLSGHAKDDAKAAYFRANSIQRSNISAASLATGYQREYCAPGGNLVFELRQARRSGKHVVRVFYTAQTFDQLRELTPLTLEHPPATQTLFVPNGSRSRADLDVSFRTFEELLENAINLKFVQNPATEISPGPLTGVPLK
jgi:hypothetical protein